MLINDQRRTRREEEKDEWIKKKKEKKKDLIGFVDWINVVLEGINFRIQRSAVCKATVEFKNAQVQGLVRMCSDRE
jgi:hypothetical protein